LQGLPKLRAVRIVFEECPYTTDLLKLVFSERSFRVFDPHVALMNIETVFLAAAEARTPEIFCDWLPFLEDTGPWLPALCLATPQLALGALESLDLEVARGAPIPYLSTPCFPLIQSLRRLSLTIRHDSAEIRREAPETLETPVIPHTPLLTPEIHSLTQLVAAMTSLEELRLAGIAVTAKDLLELVKEARNTLRRLRLGRADGSSQIIGFVVGTFKDFMKGYRQVEKVLERLELAGQFYEVVPGEEASQDATQVRSFYPVMNGMWEEMTTERGIMGTTTDGCRLESYVIHGGEYPQDIWVVRNGGGDGRLRFLPDTPPDSN